MSPLDSKIYEDDGAELKRQLGVMDAKKEELGQEYYGYGAEGSGGTKGFDFHYMTSRERSWNHPVMYHGTNAAACCGGGYGLYFFFAKPVHNKAFHLVEMLRRTCVGTLYSFPFCMGIAHYVRTQADAQHKHNINHQLDQDRKVCVSINHNVGYEGVIYFSPALSKLPQTLTKF